jgi:ATP-dependent Clp protease ATP-binding subunit ClpA
MFDRFSEQARRTIFWARAEAGRLGSEAIEQEHLLLGLLIEDQGESERAMASFVGNQTVVRPQTAPPIESFFRNETAGKLRLTLAESTSTGASKPNNVGMPLAERAQWALSAAKEHAGIATVQPLHILWGLISDKESPVGNLLNATGVTVEQVEDAIRSRRKSPG